jgi:hypothetical protein
VNGHTTFKLKRRVYVVLRDGTSFVDRLIDQRSRYYQFEHRGRVRVEDIRTAAYAKPTNPANSA